MERATNKNKRGFEIYDEEKLEFEDYYDKLKEYEDIEENRNINIPVIFKALEDGFWIKEDRCFLRGDELERFKHKNSSYYDEENKLIFCPGVKADTDRVIHAKPSLAVTSLLDGKITYYLSTRIACVLLEDYGKT